MTPEQQKRLIELELYCSADTLVQLKYADGFCLERGLHASTHVQRLELPLSDDHGRPTLIMTGEAEFVAHFVPLEEGLVVLDEREA